jgi:uncharacterized protein YbjQ (UPF0145 family)
MRSGSHSATCRATSARSRCIGNVARWATDLGADAVRFASVERRQPVSLGSVRVRLAVRIGQVSVRLRCYGNRSRCGSQLTRNVGRQRVGLATVRIRQRAALPRPGLGASATLHAGQPTSVRMRMRMRFASVERRQPVLLGSVRVRLAVRIGQVSVRLRCYGNRSRCGSQLTRNVGRQRVGSARYGSHSATCRATSARSRCIGNVARWATDLGADAVRFASVERRQPVLLRSVRVRLAVRIGQVSVRLRCYGNRSRCGSQLTRNVGRQRVGLATVRIRQRAALPRPGLGASATLHAGQPTSVRLRCGSHRLNVGNRSRWGAFACGLRFASARSRCGCGATATGLGAVRS